MRSKKLLATLIVALMLLLTGCGSDTPRASEESSASEKTSITKSVDTERFSAENVKITGASYIDYSCIITDNVTGKQYLYTWYSSIYSGGSSMVEIGTINDTNNATN